MSAPSPLRPTLHPRTAEILRRAYRYESAEDVLDRAVLMLATADGHLHPDGRPIVQPGTRRRT